jgi:hypothetical protein
MNTIRSLVRKLRPACLGLAAAVILWSGRAAAQPAFIPDDGRPDTPPSGAQEERPKVDITRPYWVGPQAGEWMICASTYTGQFAPTMAVQLAEQIQARHHVPAYVFNRADEERRHMQEDQERAMRAAQEQGLMLPRTRDGRLMVRRYHIEEQCAVLIGGPGHGWSNPDDASAFLQKVRKWPLPEFRLPDGVAPYDYAWAALMKEKKGEKPDIRIHPVNPYALSFVTRNPSVPRDNKPANRYDPAWEKWNADEEYSLLKCPKPWTLVVKEYLGNRVVQSRGESSSFLEKIGLGGGQVGASLCAAGASAHQLAELLQKLGFQAYVLHMRTSSVVTVGAFTGPKDPELERTADRLARFSFKRQDTGATYDLGLFPRPVPIEVPHP